MGPYGTHLLDLLEDHLQLFAADRTAKYYEWTNP